MTTKTVTINPQGTPNPKSETLKGKDTPGGPGTVKFKVNGPNSFVLCFPPRLFGGNERRQVVCGGETSKVLTVKVSQRHEPYRYSITPCPTDCDCDNTNKNPCNPVQIEGDRLKDDDPPEMIIE